MDGPVRAPRFPELPGAIEGVNDPDALVAQPLGAVGALLGEQPVLGVELSDGSGQELVGSLVALMARLVWGQPGIYARAQLDQEPSCFAGQASGLEVVRRRDTGTQIRFLLWHSGPHLVQ